MHKLLNRQLRRHFGKSFEESSFSEDTLKLLENVSKSYDELYNEKKFLEHVISVNSQDLEKANEKIMQQNEHLKYSLDKTSDENEEIVYLLQQYKEAIDASLIVSTTDVTGKIKYANDNFCRISGYSRDELIGKDHNIIRHPDNSKKIFKKMWKTILKREVWQGVFPNLAKDGSTYYVDATIVPFTNIFGEIVEFVALRKDITKRIEYQNEIQSEKSRVSEILNNQESIIVLFTYNDGVVEANKKFYEVFNFSSLKDFKEKHHCVCELFEEKEDFIKGTKDELWIKPILNEPDKVHLAMINKRIYSVKVAHIDVEYKNTCLATFTDITEIEIARVKSQEAEKEKSNFLANMSHEIRTPMNAILGFSELLAKTELDQRQNKFTELIRSSSATLIHIINDILDFSKLESGQIDIKLTNVNPFIEFEETFMLLSQKAKEKNISYMINIDSKLNECIEIDSFHIKQILINLIGNAIKFTPLDGTIDIKIEKKSLENQNILRFSVQDTGIGIPKNRQEKIFDPFSQVDSSTTRKFGGTGLGLSISNSLVNMLDSKLQLDSEEGVGSKFYFDIKYENCVCENSLKTHLQEFDVYLCKLNDAFLSNISNQLNTYKIEFKIIKEFDKSIDSNESIIITTNEKYADRFEHAKILLISNTDKNYNNQNTIEMFEEFPSLIYNELMRLKLIKTEVTPSIKKLNLKVLVAEDYEINRILVSELLDQLSIKYEFALNGQEAIEMLEKNSYDLILMDINMPVMNGIDASKIIINELKIKTPIIALTANALEGDREMFLSIGMADYLSKPIDTKAFENLLVKYHKKINSSKNVDFISEDSSGNSKQDLLDIKSSLAQASKNMNFSETIIKKLFNSYVKSLNEFEKNIENSIDIQDFETMEINAHNLKSGAASLCFNPIVELAQELESCSKLKDESFDYKENFKKIKSYLKVLKKKIDDS